MYGITVTQVSKGWWVSRQEIDGAGQPLGGVNERLAFDSAGDLLDWLSRAVTGEGLADWLSEQTDKTKRRVRI